MDTANRFAIQFGPSFRRITALIWNMLRSPALTGVLLLLLAIVLVLRLFVPQQLTPDTAAAAWATTLPPVVQGWGGFLHNLGLSRLFYSGWFWVILGLLLLNSLIAIADYAVPTWRRVQNANDPAAMNWRHPLAFRVERTVRLPENVDQYVDQLKAALRASGFTVNATAEDGSRLVAAARRPWLWYSVLAFYGGLALLSLAFWISFQTLENEQLTVYPRELESSTLLDGSLELSEVSAESASGTLIVTTGEDGARAVSWQLYWPTILGDHLFLPVAMEPALVVEAVDAAGDPLRLMPLREDLYPAVRLYLPLDRPDEAHYFLIPSVALAFQISPVAASAEDRYNIQLKRGTDSTPAESMVARLGESVAIDDLTLTIGSTHSLTIDARRDPALPLYAVSIGLIAVSASLLIVFSPWQVWLVPEVKGRGGQLYASVERIGLARTASGFLDRLLADGDQQET